MKQDNADHIINKIENELTPRNTLKIRKLDAGGWEIEETVGPAKLITSCPLEHELRSVLTLALKRQLLL